jgi:glyceraldehyde 3-phosphate dehydrogenase
MTHLERLSSPKVRIAINGFGRIGRNAFRIALTKPWAQVVAINDITDAATLAHLLKYDTAYGTLDELVEATADGIKVGRVVYPVSAIKEPAKLPWKKIGVDVVLECTGLFTDEKSLKDHLKAGAKKAILSAPAKGGNVPTFVLGVNSAKYKNQNVINNASCTTNCIAPVAAVIQAALGIQKASMTTIHAYTADQRLQDAPHEDLRRGRAAAENIVPTTTGAALAATEAVPELKGLFDGLAIRVPVVVGSLADFTFVTKKKTTMDEVNQLFIKASREARWQGILAVTNEPIVSSDIVGRSESSIVDLSLTQVVDGDLVKVIAWYDNEWGYANRLVEMARAVAN